MATLIVNFHPNPQYSEKGRKLIELIAPKLHATVHNIADYVSMQNPVIPQQKIDEVHDLIMAHDRICLVSPIHWYNVTAIGRMWIEQIFSDKFALNPDYSKPLIGGKKLMIACTTGAPSSYYTNEQCGNAETLLKGFRNTCFVSHLVWQGAFLFSPDEDFASKSQLVVQAAK